MMFRVGSGWSASVLDGFLLLLLFFLPSTACLSVFEGARCEVSMEGGRIMVSSLPLSFSHTTDLLAATGCNRLRLRWAVGEGQQSAEQLASMRTGAPCLACYSCWDPKLDLPCSVALTGPRDPP